MRFALIATAAAAAVAVPLAVQAAGPHMSDGQFLNAVRCAAYESALAPQADIVVVRARLNLEAQRQPSATVRQAHNEVKSIAADAAAVANPAQAAMMRAERAEACSAAPLMAGAVIRDAA